MYLIVFTFSKSYFGSSRLDKYSIPSWKYVTLWINIFGTLPSKNFMHINFLLINHLEQKYRNSFFSKIKPTKYYCLLYDIPPCGTRHLWNIQKSQLKRNSTTIEKYGRIYGLEIQFSTLINHIYQDYYVHQY